MESRRSVLTDRLDLFGRGSFRVHGCLFSSVSSKKCFIVLNDVMMCNVIGVGYRFSTLFSKWRGVMVSDETTESAVILIHVSDDS